MRSHRDFLPVGAPTELWNVHLVGRSFQGAFHSVAHYRQAIAVVRPVVNGRFGNDPL